MATGSELSTAVSNTLVSVGDNDLNVPPIGRLVYICKDFITIIGCMIIVLALSCGVIQKKEAIILLAILQCFALHSDKVSYIASVIKTAINKFVRVSSFDSMNETTQAMQNIVSSEATTEDLATKLSI